ncbi:MAG: phenylalanine--tRNA ligase subunit beta [Planctomycetota bacterium]|jgi:phenylalanyl-tRNA synthetase beta chain
MEVSARWINDYLDPPATPEEQGDLLTRAGFPLEGSEPVEDDDDVRQDFEMTSNRGDCVCHVGLAREIAAISGRTLTVPVAAPEATGPPAADLVRVTNHEPERCPLYTARLIRGVTVRPSPDWLTSRLRARGDIPRNNIVDATNFVLFELGQPTHVFDLATLAGPEIVVRMARPDEPFLPIGEGAAGVRLHADDLVIADAENAVAMAGVKGGALSAVTDGTTDILLEAATFDPVWVRNTSRRHQIASDSSYRFERGVHPGQVNAAADRLAQLILELAGGELCAGVVSDGAAIPAPRRASMRTDRCRWLLGVELPDERMVDALDRLGFAPRLDGGVIECTVPVHRLDVEREIDLVEEVGRVFGHDEIPMNETLQVRVSPLQPSVEADQAVRDELTGMGFLETVSHTLVGETPARLFCPEGAGLLHVEDERAGAEPILRPSLMPSLLRVLAHNRDQGITGLRLFESAAAFWLEGDEHREQVRLGLLMENDDPGQGLRPLRGVVERLVDLVAGHEHHVTVEASDRWPWLAPGAAVSAVDTPLGWIGVLAADAMRPWDLPGPLLAAELDLPLLYDRFPPLTIAHALPAFPAIERDVTADLAEGASWQAVRDVVDGLDVADLEALDFVTVYRGRQAGAGRKSLTLRLRFRAADRTLTHDEIDPRVEQVVAAMKERLEASVRT